MKRHSPELETRTGPRLTRRTEAHAQIIEHPGWRRIWDEYLLSPLTGTTTPADNAPNRAGHDSEPSNE